ncbi:MAG: tRNA (adenosine(37)-N6)-threonylcarbamoyltransferase complex dimerization subunit type 1 TsaB [Chromatocurvus sp.]
MESCKGRGERLLGIETATDACSVALCLEGETDQRHERNPRQHSRRLFPMLIDLLANRSPASLRLDAIAYGCGPGSFTGLRIAASAAQGLAFSLNLPVVPVSTLACQAATARREHDVPANAVILSTLDANIGQVYWALYQATHETLVELMPPAVCTPEALPLAAILAQKPENAPFVTVGSGVALIVGVPGLPANERYDDVLPQARDLLSLARVALLAGATEAAADVSPMYVQDATRWKKLAEQGPRA